MLHQVVQATVLRFTNVLLRIANSLVTSLKLALREKCPYSELFWSIFSRIRTEFGEIWNISPYSVRMRENTDQNNSEYRHFLRSVAKLSICYDHSFIHDFFMFMYVHLQPMFSLII